MPLNGMKADKTSRMVKACGLVLPEQSCLDQFNTDMGYWAMQLLSYIPLKLAIFYSTSARNKCTLYPQMNMC